ncbi:E3 ubiquitin- ligase rnf168 [Pelobates cultripes]|uniref:RING-type E3 ubiquitin transferase n=1 Tax=Pelobates cultripes TaxID=61616 RepID=A0AAD1RA58_PELCU|nr:E3 ubiquitin- ligase rnf168 [Pelobates cultripes]
MPRKENPPLTWSECVCTICQEILLEPVTLPCNHTLCNPCFQLTVEKASLSCPFCRKRVSTWARYHARSGTLVNKSLWLRIQSQYPEECKLRASGQEIEDMEDESVTFPSRLLCKPGEIRQEYEAEISKIEAERLAKEEAERKASEEYIQKLLEEEQEEQRHQTEASRREMEEQLRQDEELARSLSNDLNASSTSSVVCLEGSPVVHKKAKPSKSCRNSKVKQGQSADIERFLSPKHMRDEVKNADPPIISPYIERSITVFDEDANEMPTLSPQVTLPAQKHLYQAHTEEQVLDLEVSSILEHHNESQQTSEVIKNLCLDELYTPCARVIGDNIRQRLGSSNSETVDFCPTSVSKSDESNTTHSFSGWNSTTSTPKQQLKKRKCDECAIDPSEHLEDCGKGKRKRMPDIGSYTDTGCHVLERDEKLFDLRQQEEQDRLLALQLQKELDKEMKQVIRHKGSPDEYHLRPKQRNEKQEYKESTHLEPEPKTITQPKSGKGKGVSSPDENKKPQREILISPKVKEKQATEKMKILWPRNKQQTILELFKKSASK